jgi:MFS family permease
MNAQLNEVMGRIYSSDQVSTRIEAINVSSGGETKAITLSETLCDPRYSRATFVGVSLSALQQLSGINLVMFFGGGIFSGVLTNWGNFIQPLIGFVNWVPVIPAYFMIGKFGRKSILTVCSFLIALSLVGCGVSLIISTKQKDKGEDSSVAGIASLVCVVIYIILFELSLGPLCWIYQTEIMNEKGLSIGVSINLILTVTASLLAPILFRLFKGWVFIVCAIFSLICALFCMFFMKETKGLSEKEIAHLYCKDQMMDDNADLLD